MDLDEINKGMSMYKEEKGIKYQTKRHKSVEVKSMKNQPVNEKEKMVREGNQESTVSSKLREQHVSRRRGQSPVKRCL